MNQYTTNRISQEEVANQKSERIMQGVATWCSYYRANPHRFCEDYLNIQLKLFQKILIFMMNVSTHFMYIAARGQGKTYLTAVFCVVRCILYPGTQIRVVSKTRNQASEVLLKIKDILLKESTNLRLEIQDMNINQQKAEIVFKNTSGIKVVTANETARGNRSNIIIIDEFRMVDVDIINTVIRKFNTSPRQPKYLKKKEYSHLAERNKEIYMSSAWFQSSWAYQKMKAYFANLLDDTKNYFLVGLPYQLSIAENLLMREQIEDEMSEADFNSVTHSMEMECLWYSDADGRFYRYDDISKNQVLEFPYYPNEISSLIKDKRIRIPDLHPSERRILSADLALMASTKQDNDATSIFINQLVPSARNSFKSNIVYTTNIEGEHTADQALTIRRLFEEFKCTDLVIDAKGNGFGIVDTLLGDIHDPQTGITYNALSCCNNPEIAARCKNPNAKKVIWAINASKDFNSKCAMFLREGFKQKKIKLLQYLPDNELERSLKRLKGYAELPLEQQVLFKLPYIHTALLINELINLDVESDNTGVKVIERAGARKDRYSSLSYNYYVAIQIIRELGQQKKETNFDRIINMARAPKIYV